ncbi:CU044_5270 family protein [Streptomyces sp. NBC_00328]|uniref:CU044_5270 family protein n=1 Tax=Streptomyces sp. NBC_00328 TaxID=2903646 RepID=UPI002E2830EB|nr:CU044_5270 family protein [Streptomyces sp. NBC_00328]
MDEMTEVRELRAHVPVPDRARLAPGRARLTETARAGQSRRALWLRWEFAIVAVVAAVTAVAVAVTLLVGGKGSGGTVQPAATPGVRFKGVSAAEFLRQAADAVRTQPNGTVPTAKQWIYTKTAQEPPNKSHKFMGDLENWIRYDGSAGAFRLGDRPLDVTKMHLENGGAGDERSPREMYRVLTALPADGRGTLKALREQDAIADSKEDSQARNDYFEIRVLLSADVMPAKGLASLYRALALLPGGKVTGHLVDTAAGRRVIALDYSRGEDPRTGESMHDQWLIDPQTYRIVGKRIVSGEGKVLGGDSLVATAVVDKAGDRS